MTAPVARNRLILGLALALPCVASVVLMLIAPGTVRASTYALVMTLLLATAAVVLNTWRNAQPTSTAGQLVYETESGRL